ILFRIKNDGKKLLRSKKLLYSNSIDKENLYSIISNKTWFFEMTGYITNNDLKEIINNEYILPKGACLNTEKTVMDAENFYVQSKNLRDPNKIFEEIN
ncbi:MAG: hypothetical protein ACRCZO_02420, partial [Cetobacterium sp.]